MNRKTYFILILSFSHREKQKEKKQISGMIFW
jgi:hypothetical protein